MSQRVGKSEEAYLWLSKALVVDDNNIEVLAALGEFYSLTGRSDEAQRCFEKILKVSSFLVSL